MEDQNKENQDVQEEQKPDSLEDTLKATQELLQQLVDENRRLTSELNGVKEANLRLAKSMPAKPVETFESTLAAMFDLKGGDKK